MDALPGTSANAHVTFPPWRNHHHLPPFPADLNHNLTPASLSPCPSSAPTSFLAFMPLGRCVVRLLLSSVRRDANHQSSRGFCRPLMDRCGQSVHQCLPAGTVRIVGTLAVSSPPDFKCPLFWILDPICLNLSDHNYHYFINVPFSFLFFPSSSDFLLGSSCKHILEHPLGNTRWR